MDRMHSTSLRLVSLFFIAISASGQDGILDLENLNDYVGQATPGYINKDNTPASNPITNIGATLGRVLFYDKRLSKNDSISCASCHQQENAFSDTAIASVGVNGTTERHSMRLINARFAEEDRFFWDERANSLEDQSTQPIQDHVEMGFSGTNGDANFSALLSKLSAIEEYQVLFESTFGDAAIDEDRIQRALSQFVRSIQSFDSRYDEGRSAVNNDNDNFPNFSAAENAGKDLFMNRPPRNGGDPRGAGCNACHQAPEFDIDSNIGNNGVVGVIGGGNDITNTRSPSLRDLTDTSGQPHTAFMHDASLPTLLDVINHYNAIPGNVQGLDQRLRPGGQPQQLNLSQTEKDNLVAFLKTLSGTNVYTDEKWSDPFDANGQLALAEPAPVLNLSTRGRIGTGDNVLIGGIIVEGTGTKKVLVTGRGQSISSSVPGRISNPQIRLVSGTTVIATSDDWASEANSAAISALPEMPASNVHPNDAAILIDLAPGAYTAIVDGVGGAEGIGIVEIFDLEVNSTATLANLSTRGAVGSGDNVLIGGVIVGGNTGQSAKLVIRGRGPSVPVAGQLADPLLQFFNGASLYLTNDNWGSGTSTADFTGEYSSYAPTNGFDAAEVQIRPSNSATTAILSGASGQTGIGIVEVFVAD